MTPDAHMVETLRLRTAALHRVIGSSDLLRRENDDLRARLTEAEKANRHAETALARVHLLADMWDEQYLFPASKVDFADAAKRCAESLRAALDGTP